MIRRVICNSADCFACDYRSCLILEDSYGTRVCPFFKTVAQIQQERDAAEARLRSMGRDDLIEKFTSQKRGYAL